MKNTELDKRIRAMKEVILNIHRSASELDTIVQRIENVSKIANETDEDYRRMGVIIKREFQHRKEMNRIFGFDVLEEREDFAWEKLLASVEK